jgi:hypothetical protein
VCGFTWYKQDLEAQKVTIKQRGWGILGEIAPTYKHCKGVATRRLGAESSMHPWPLLMLARKMFAKVLDMHVSLSLWTT